MRRGTVAVEMALLLPLLLLLLFGMLEYGSLFWRAQQIGAAARQGARIGALPSGTATAVTTTVDAMMDNAGLGDAGYSVTLNPANPAALAPGETFTVTITVPYPAIQLTGFPVPTPDDIERSTTMAKEGT
jgi:Flp pilus assembly protein TadG